MNNTTKDFFRMYEENTNFQLQDYHQSHPEIFTTYFNNYCKKTPKKLTTAEESYPHDYERLKEVSALLPGVIEKLSAKGEDYFGFTLPVSAHIFTGLYASNAFVDHQMEMYFAIEKLSPDPNLLRVIVAHEMIHSYHYHLLGRAGINWQAIDWSDVRNSLYLEGVATYLSEKFVPGHPQYVYFSYEDEGEDWLNFCKQNHKKIAAAFLDDLDSGNVNMEKEWLRLSGGQYFNYNRLGYYLGTAFVRDLLEKLPEDEVLRMLAEKDIAGEMERWMRQWG